MKRLVALLALAGSSSALASPAGGVFSGPARSTGTSFLWNPAAVVSEADGVFTHVEVAGIVFGASYERQPEDPAGEPDYEPVSFTSAAPNPAFTVGFGGLWPGLKLLAGGAALTAAGSAWPSDGAQRYFGTDSLLLAYLVGAGVAFSPDERFGLALAAGPTYVRIRLDNAIDFGAFANNSLTPGGELFAREDPALEGASHIALSGWTLSGVLGAWARPVPPLTLGASFVWTRTAELDGTIEVTAPDTFTEAFPDYDVSPSGDLTLTYPMPWTGSLEAELKTAAGTFAVLGQYQNRSGQSVLLGSVTEAEAQVIAGRQISVKATHDDWMLGARYSRQLDEALEVGVRLDWDPRYIPKQALTAVNLDFTTLELGVGGRYVLAPGRVVTVSYSYVHAVPVDVDQSIFNPRAPPESGLNLPSARGRYDGYAHKLVLAFEGLFAP